MKVKFKIKRCDPVNDASCEPYVQAYSVNVEEGMTVLEAVAEIAEKQDPTLTYRKSCRSAICGSCAMKMNGFPKLACSTQVLHVAKDGELLLEPLDNFEVIRDLAVDMTPFWEKMERITPYLTRTDGEDARMTHEDEKRIDNVQQCIMCASCNSVCNALEMDKHYAGPAALAKAWRFVGDAREGEGEKRLTKLSLEHNAWDCVRCVHCTQFCPKGVEPLRAIELLRSSAMKKGVCDNHGAKHAEAMIDSIKRVGRLDEAAMSFKTLGILKTIGMIPFGLKMEMHGKMPHPIIFPAIEDIEEVRKIYAAYEKKRGGKK